MCSLHWTHPSTRSLVLGASYCTAPGEQWEWGGGEGGCPVRCSRAPRQGRRWTGTSPSSSPHSILRSGWGPEPATLRLTVQAPTDWATAAHWGLCVKVTVIDEILVNEMRCIDKSNRSTIIEYEKRGLCWFNSSEWHVVLTHRIIYTCFLGFMM